MHEELKQQAGSGGDSQKLEQLQSENGYLH